MGLGGVHRMNELMTSAQAGKPPEGIVQNEDEAKFYRLMQEHAKRAKEKGMILCPEGEYEFD